MKLRSRIFIVFIFSVIISVVVFLVATSYMYQYLGWKGISEFDVHNASYEIIMEIWSLENLEKEQVKAVLDRWAGQYKGMQFELVSDRMQVIYATDGRKEGYDLVELTDRISKRVFGIPAEIAVSKPVVIRGEVKGFLITVVPSEAFLPLIISIWNIKGVSIVGIIVLTGLVITLVVSSVFAFVFTLRISRRFSRLYRNISSFELGNLDVKIEDRSGDELGKLAASFNGMAQKLKEQLGQEKEYQQERQKLVSNISHDLRTPLTSIVGYSESLINGVYESEEEQRKYIHILHKRALYMEKLLGELLEFSRMESGALEIRRETEDLAELCRETLIEYIPVLQEKGMALLAEIPDNSIAACIDKDRISRAIRNIIDNAVKYGHEGKYLRLSVIEKEDAVRIEIEDRGPGIEPENRQKVFQRFYRGDKARNTMDGGMGLGLSIAYEIIKRHGGEIKIDSQTGKGTTFTVVI